MSFVSKLFERKYLSEYTDADGKVMKVKLSKRQIEQMIQKGALEKLITVHILSTTREYYKETWSLGEIGIDKYAKFKDENGDLYSAVKFEKGKLRQVILKKKAWDEIKQVYEGLDKQHEEFNFDKEYKKLMSEKI